MVLNKQGHLVDFHPLEGSIGCRLPHHRAHSHNHQDLTGHLHLEVAIQVNGVGLMRAQTITDTRR